MDKSGPEEYAIFLTDSDKEIEKKIAGNRNQGSNQLFNVFERLTKENTFD